MWGPLLEDVSDSNLQGLSAGLRGKERSLLQWTDSLTGIAGSSDSSTLPISRLSRSDGSFLSSAWGFSEVRRVFPLYLHPVLPS